MSKATIREVAEAAGVSVATVSRALNNHPSVAPRTREKIEEVARALNYTLSRSASSLASGRAMRVPIYFDAPLNTWFNSSVTQGIYEALLPHGYEIAPVVVSDREDLADHLRRLPENPNVDGAVIVSFALTKEERHIASAAPIPLVGVNTPVPNGLDASVSVDSVAAVADAVRLLHSLGHRRMAFVEQAPSHSLSSDSSFRFQSFRNTCADLDISDDDVHGVLVSPSLSDAHDFSTIAVHAASQILSLPQPPTAICIESDDLAVHVLRVLRQQQAHIPGQFSIVGFDDNPVAELVGLSTVRQDPRALAQDAAKILVELMRGETEAARHLTVPGHIVLRETTAQAPT